MPSELAVALGYVLELAMAVPATIMALLPARNRLRVPARVAFMHLALVLVALILLGSVIASQLRVPSNFVLLPASVPVFVAFGRVVDLGFWKRLFCFANAIMLCAFSTMWTIVALFRWETDDGVGVLLPKTALAALGLAVAIGAIFWRTLTVKLPALLSYRDIDSSWRWLTAIPVCLAALICWIVPRDLTLMAYGRATQIMLLITALIPAAAWLIYHIAWWMTSAITDAGRLRQENTLLRAQEKRYEELMRYMDETRTLRHDFRHHLLVLDAMARENKSEELSAYLAELVGVEQRGRATMLAANPAVDALATYYDAQARGERIRITWSLELPERLPVAESDFCAILGNLVENAIIAVRDLAEPERHIEVRAREITETTLGLTVSNPYAGKVRLGADGLPKTHRRGHGIGLASVVTCAQTYGGGVDVRCEDGVFFVGVILCHDESQESSTSA